MLKELFAWLDGHPWSYWLGAMTATVALFGVVGAAVGQELRGRPASRWSVPRDALVLLFFLFAWRWPFLLDAHQFNPDESHVIAGSITLSHDPVFWRAVDGATSGPLNFYFLVPFHWLGLPLDYFTARLGGLLLIAGALFACHRALAVPFGRAVAWLGLLPLAGFFATVTHEDFLQFSTEHLPLFLLALPIWLLSTREPGDRRRLWAACFFAGLAPWAKLQAAPLGLALIGWGLVQEWRQGQIPVGTKLRGIASALVAAAIPTFLMVIMAVATGQAETAWRRFILYNLSYTNEGRPLGDALQAMKRMAEEDGRLPLFLAIACSVLVAAIIWSAVRRIRPSVRFWAGAVLTLAAVATVLGPRREFLHYTLFLPVPLTFFVGAAIGSCWVAATSRLRWILAAVLGIGAGLPLIVTRCQHGPPNMFGEFVRHWQRPRTSTGELVHALARPGDSLAIWGWAANLFVETNLPQALRDGVTIRSIFDDAQLDYHRASLLEDFRRHQPAVFVDAVGPGAFALNNRAQQAHEIFPALAEEIRRNYVLVYDLEEARVYARKGLPTLAALSGKRIEELLDHGRMHEGFSAIEPTRTPSYRLKGRVVQGRFVAMMEPPSHIEWDLDSSVHQVGLEFGFDPEAYERGSTNGAELLLELEQDGASQVVWRHLMDPRRNPADRGLQAAWLPLPPFSTDARLVVRIDAGPNGDPSWDKVYLATMRFRRGREYIPDQFPGFVSIPDSVVTPFVAPVMEGDGFVMQFHAPAAITYRRTGREEKLRFDYGFLPGAYTGGGNTDGARFKVELRAAGQAPGVLFERLLQPVQKSADQGRQRADVTLPAGKAGDEIVISIDPGAAGNNAWDWTYLARAELK